MSAAAAAAPVVAIEDWSKTFSGRTVLRDVDLELRGSEVHALLGQNGSGKSTLIKALAGYHAPDPGARLAVRGEPVALPLAPGEAGALGLSFVHQDLALVETATVLENLRCGQFETGAGWRISWRRERERARRSLARFGGRIDPDAKVGDLRDVDRALVAIARALDRLEGHDAGLLVLDEPTAFLPRDGIEALFAAVRGVAASGCAVLFVTHRLDEARALCDRASVLRDGALVATVDIERASERDLVRAILGFALADLYPEPHEPRRELALAVRGLTGAVVAGLDLDLHRGEVLGLAGLQGMGAEEVPYLLAGAGSARAGTVGIGDGRTAQAASLSPRAALDLGVALLPANRQRWGVVGAASVEENVTLPALRRYFRHGHLDRRRERADVRALLDDFEVAPPDPRRAIATLSGGNQQKALLGKWFATGPRVLALHEPTQGVDVGARRQIFHRIRAAAEAGTAFLMASSEHEDLAHVCDRVLVLRDGRVVAELHGDELTEARIAERCLAEPAPAAPSEARA